MIASTLIGTYDSGFILRNSSFILASASHIRTAYKYTATKRAKTSTVDCACMEHIPRRTGHSGRRAIRTVGGLRAADKRAVHKSSRDSIHRMRILEYSRKRKIYVPDAWQLTSPVDGGLRVLAIISFSNAVPYHISCESTADHEVIVAHPTTFSSGNRENRCPLPDMVFQVIASGVWGLEATDQANHCYIMFYLSSVRARGRVEKCIKLIKVG